jgi:hypothetical protein
VWVSVRAVAIAIKLLPRYQISWRVSNSQFSSELKDFHRTLDGEMNARARIYWQIRLDKSEANAPLSLSFSLLMKQAD